MNMKKGGSTMEPPFYFAVAGLVPAKDSGLVPA